MLGAVHQAIKGDSMVGMLEWLDHPASPPIKAVVDCFRVLVCEKTNVVLISSRPESEMAESTRGLLDRLHGAFPEMKAHSFEYFQRLDEQYGGDFVALAQGDRYSFGIDEITREINRAWRHQVCRLTVSAR